MITLCDTTKLCVLRACVCVCMCVCVPWYREYACVYELGEPLPLTGSPWIPDWPWSPGSPDAPTAPVGPDCPVRPGSPLSPWVWKGRRRCRHGNKEKSFKTSATACIILLCVNSCWFSGRITINLRSKWSECSHSGQMTKAILVFHLTVSISVSFKLTARMGHFTPIKPLETLHLEGLSADVNLSFTCKVHFEPFH